MKDKSSTSTILKTDGMHCASCQKPIEKALRETTGVNDVSIGAQIERVIN
jgi:copper chaperone CopZ